MGLLNWFKRKSKSTALATAGRFGLDELSRRLGVPIDTLRGIEPSYHEFFIAKRSGGSRRILAPSRDLKHIQRIILRRLLRRIKAHPCVTGFERGHSIATNAQFHAGQAVVVRFDLRDFFQSTSTLRVNAWFRRIGWTGEAADLLTRLTTFDGGLPQGAPTSPRLSSLVNGDFDAQLAELVQRRGIRYTRYADDLTFSFPVDDPAAVRRLHWLVVYVTRQYDFRLNSRKQRVYRRHQRQVVTGLVVNAGARLPRTTRRWLRAVEHRLASGAPVTLTPSQIHGWRAFASMIDTQRNASQRQ